MDKGNYEGPVGVKPKSKLQEKLDTRKVRLDLKLTDRQRGLTDRQASLIGPPLGGFKYLQSRVTSIRFHFTNESDSLSLYHVPF